MIVRYLLVWTLLFVLPGMSQSHAAEDTLHAVLVGVNDYYGTFRFSDEAGSVEHAVPKMVEALVELKKWVGFRDVRIEAYADLKDGRPVATTDLKEKNYGDERWWQDYGKKARWDVPSRENILAAVERLFDDTASKIKKGDTLLFYFTGHGFEEKNDLRLNTKFAGHDKRDKRKDADGEKTYIDLRDDIITDAINRLISANNKDAVDVKRIIIFLDNCAIDVSKFKLEGEWGGYINTLTNTYPELFIFSATIPKEYARIHRKKKMGYFTWRLVKALMGQMPLNEYQTESHRLMADVLKKYIDDTVRDDTDKKQSPAAYFRGHNRILFGRPVQDVYLYILPAPEELTRRAKGLWLPDYIINDVKEVLNGLRTGLSSKLVIGGEQVQSGKARLARNANLLFDCLVTDHTVKIDFGECRSIRGVTYNPGGTRQETNELIKGILLTHKNIFEHQNANITRIVIVLRVSIRNNARSLHSLFIDRKSGEWTKNVIPMGNLSIEETNLDIPEWQRISIAARKRMAAALPNFDRSIRATNLFISCFIFDSVTLSMIDKHFSEAEQIELVELWSRFPSRLNQALVTRKGFEGLGFAVTSLNPGLLAGGFCDDLVPMRVGQIAQKLRDDRDFMYPGPELGASERNKSNIVLGGVVEDQINGAQPIVTISPRINTDNWKKFAGGASPPTVQGPMRDDENMQSKIIDAVATVLRKLYAKLYYNK